jgi:hypothetical protein
LMVSVQNTGSFRAVTSSQVVVAFGSGLFLTDNSCKVMNGATASELSRWTSDSAVKCKICDANWYGIEGIVSLPGENAKFGSSLPAVHAKISLLWSMEVLIGLFPTSGGMNINVLGPTIGNHDASLRCHLGNTAAMTSKWISDSLIATKASAGVGCVCILKVSSGGNARQHQFQGSLAMYTAIPEIDSLTVTDNRVLSVQGMSMGVHEPKQILSYRSMHHLQGKVPYEITVLHASNFSKSCRMVDFQMKLLMENFSRVDGLAISLISPQGVAFSLMKNKCKGCYKKSIEFRLSDGGSNMIPNHNCVDGKFRFDYFPVLRELLLSSQGDWKIVAAAGSENDFVTISVQNDVHVQDYLGLVNANEQAAFEMWSSDSGLAMVRGTFNAKQLLPNILVSGQMGQNKVGPISAEYKPVLTSVSCFIFPETGSVMITIIGNDLAQAIFVGNKTWQSFDRGSLSAVVKTGETSCESSPWQSHSSILCKATGRPLSDVVSVVFSFASAVSTRLLELPENGVEHIDSKI